MILHISHGNLSSFLQSILTSSHYSCQKLACNSFFCIALTLYQNIIIQQMLMTIFSRYVSCCCQGDTHSWVYIESSLAYTSLRCYCWQGLEDVRIKGQGRIHGISRLPSSFLPAERKRFRLTDGLTDRQTDRPTDGPTNRAGHRVACTRLKRSLRERKRRDIQNKGPLRQSKSEQN